MIDLIGCFVGFENWPFARLGGYYNNYNAADPLPAPYLRPTDLSTGYPQSYPQDIHRLIHRANNYLGITYYWMDIQHWMN